MYKTTAVIEPHIIEPESTILETQTGKKLEIFNGLDPYKWIYEEHKELKRLYNNVWFELIIVCILCIVIAGLMYFYVDSIYAFALFTVIGILVLLSFRKAYLIAYKELVKFEDDMKENKLQPDMMKSLRCYSFKYWHSYYEVERLLSLSEKIFIDYEIIKNEDGQYSLKIMEADKYGAGDVRTWTCSPEVIHNIDLKYPHISTNPWGVFLRIPMDKNKTGETDNQVEAVYET